MKVALVGATGLVGQVMRQVLIERELPINEFLPVASAKNVGKKLEWNGNTTTILSLQEAVTRKPDIAIFSAGGSVSLEWAPRFAQVGTVVIDNSSAWRMDPDKPLIVPEINGAILTPEDKIIANPNCSTIQLVMPLAPLHQKFKIKRLVISTYQSITGTGAKAVAQYNSEIKGEKPEDPAYPFQIFQNCLPHCDVFQEGGYTKEEIKLVKEPRKILNDSSIAITATAVRVPVFGGHSESVNVEFDHSCTIEDLRQVLVQTPGVVLQDDPEHNVYPMPLMLMTGMQCLLGGYAKTFQIPIHLTCGS